MQALQTLQSFGRFAGTMDRNTAGLGYIKQDIGTELLLMPVHCLGFGGVLPPAGTRLNFDVVIDPALGGMLRADNVHPDMTQLQMAQAVAQVGMVQPGLAQAGMAQTGLVQPGLGALVARQPQVPGISSQLMPVVTAQPTAPVAPARAHSEGRRSGVFDREKGSFGFIKQDEGEDMFVMPRACAAFGGAFPAIGTRVHYEVVASDRTGKPRAENVRPGFAGTMDRVKGTFGFIKQDSGEDDMFVMPRCCPAFDDNFPPIGSRVTYEVVASDRTGKPRAEDVQPMYKDGVIDAQAMLQLGQAAGMFGLETDPLQLEDGSAYPVQSTEDEPPLAAIAAQATSPEDAPDSNTAIGQSFDAMAGWGQQLLLPGDEQNPKRRKIEGS